MPVLHKHQNSNGHYIIAQNKGTPVVYQLRESGVQKLRSICLGDKSKFPEWILENLKVDAEVYTINPSNIIKKEDVNARKLAFADEVRNDGGFPKCDYCTSFKGLLFVVRHEAEKKIVGEIVCNTCFAKNQFPQEAGTTLCAKNGPKVFKRIKVVVEHENFGENCFSNNAQKLVNIILNIFVFGR